MVTHGVACDAIWPILYRIFCVYQDRNIKIANRDRKRVTHIYIVKFVLSLTDRNVQIDNGMCSASVVHTHTLVVVRQKLCSHEDRLYTIFRNENRKYAAL